MTVRKYDPVTDRDQAFAVLSAGIKVQSESVNLDIEVPDRFYRTSLANWTLDDNGTLKSPNDWWVAERDGCIIGVMKIMSKRDGEQGLYGEERQLAIQELDARDGGGTELLEEAKKVAASRGKVSIVLATVRDSKAHRDWYPRKGFQHYRTDDGESLLALMILDLRSRGAISSIQPR